MASTLGISALFVVPRERAENQLLGFACASCATCMVACTKLLDKPRAKKLCVLFQCTCVDHARGCLAVFVKNCKSPNSMVVCFHAGKLFRVSALMMDTTSEQLSEQRPLPVPWLVGLGRPQP